MPMAVVTDRESRAWDDDTVRAAKENGWPLVERRRLGCRHWRVHSAMLTRVFGSMRFVVGSVALPFLPLLCAPVAASSGTVAWTMMVLSRARRWSRFSVWWTALPAVLGRIPTNSFGPSVSVCCEAAGELTQDSVALDVCQWSLNLISKILVQVIIEGSMIVMKVITLNTERSFVKAVSVAPRNGRASWILTVEVGTQTISPLAWAIQSGSLLTASAVVGDLLTSRADRGSYYYGADELFSRRYDIVTMLTKDGSTHSSLY